MNIDQINEARALATPVTQNFTADDTFPAIVIQYVPSLGTSGTSASFTLANDSFQFLVDSASPAGTDAIGTTGKIDVSAGSYDTMGEFVDTINATQAWRAYLVGSLRADTTIGLLDKTSTTCHGANGTTVYTDTTDYDVHSFAISGEQFINNGRKGHVTDKADACINSLMYGSFLITGDSDDLTITYYTGAQGSAETALTGGESITLATATVHGEENFTEPFIEATRGHRLIVRITTASAVIGAPTINAIGETAVLSGSRMVDSKNFGAA